jgi:hypothetical protein
MTDLEKLAENLSLEGMVIDLDKIGEVNGFYSICELEDNEITCPLFKYQIRTSDSDDSVFATLEKSVRVNYGGDFVTAEEVKIPDCGYLLIKDWNFTDFREDWFDEDD